MAQKEVDKYAERLALLAKGKLTEAAAVTTGGGKAADTAKIFLEADEGENADGNALKGTSKGKSKKAAPVAPLDGNCFLAWSCFELYRMSRRLSNGHNGDGRFVFCCGNRVEQSATVFHGLCGLKQSTH